jgi:hypothetical protein
VAQQWRKRDIPLDVILEELATIRQGMVQAASRLSARQWEQSLYRNSGGCPSRGEAKGQSFHIDLCKGVAGIDKM